MNGAEGEIGARRALCRAAVYRALALGFSEPTAELVALWCDGTLAVELADALRILPEESERCGPALAALRRAGLSERTIEPPILLQELQSEYARLLTGPGRPEVAACESEYVEGRQDGGRGPLWGESTAAVLSAYAEWGVAPGALSAEPPDLAATELEFLYFLCRREEEACVANDEHRARLARSSQSRFLAEHAAIWLPRFAAGVLAASTSQFYETLSRVLAAFVEAEAGLSLAAGGSVVSQARQGMR